MISESYPCVLRLHYGILTRSVSEWRRGGIIIMDPWTQRRMNDKVCQGYQERYGNSYHTRRSTLFYCACLTSNRIKRPATRWCDTGRMGARFGTIYPSHITENGVRNRFNVFAWTTSCRCTPILSINEETHRDSIPFPPRWNLERNSLPCVPTTNNPQTVDSFFYKNNNQFVCLRRASKKKRKRKAVIRITGG